MYQALSGVTSRMMQHPSASLEDILANPLLILPVLIGGGYIAYRICRSQGREDDVVEGRIIGTEYSGYDKNGKKTWTGYQPGKNEDRKA